MVAERALGVGILAFGPLAQNIAVNLAALSKQTHARREGCSSILQLRVL